MGEDSIPTHDARARGRGDGTEPAASEAAALVVYPIEGIREHPSAGLAGVDRIQTADDSVFAASLSASYRGARPKYLARLVGNSKGGNHAVDITTFRRQPSTPKRGG
jgi:hypothetical protein